MATKTKQSKSSGKRSASKPRKPTAAQTRKRQSELAENNRREVELTFADGHSRTVVRPVEPTQFGRGGSVRVSEFQSSADAASALACVDSDGQPIGRARIGTVQMQRVSDALGKRTPQQVAHALIGGKSQKSSMATLKQYASAKLTRGDLPDGASSRISDLAKVIGDPRKHKMNGRALAAAVVALASTKRG